jgi:hypothetical protein
MTTNMTTAAQPAGALQRVRGKVGPKVLIRAPELFTQSPEVVLSELLQNARRAGATHVEISTASAAGRTFMTITDNGPGIEDMQKLVTFGESGWDESLDAREHAAGMGTYSLASRGATVRSRGRLVQLTPAVFTGIEEAITFPCAEEPGTTITFPITEAEARYIAGDVEAATLHLPLTVSFNNLPCRQSPFLEHAIKVVHHEGVAIGIYTDKAWGARAREHELTHRRPSRVHGQPQSLDFHGHTIVVEGTYAPIIHEKDRLWKVAYRVDDAPGLRLVLPTRDRLIANDAAARLAAAARRALFQTIAELPDGHTLSMANVREARSIGIAMPDPLLALVPWTPSEDSSFRVTGAPVRGSHTIVDEELAEIVVLVATDTEVSRLALLQAYRELQGKFLLMERDEGLVGSPRYDALNHLSGIRIVVTATDGTKLHIGDALDDELDYDLLRAHAGDEGQPALASAIEASLVISNKKEEVDTRQADIACVILDDSNKWPSEIRFVTIADMEKASSAGIADDIGTVVYSYDSFNSGDGDTYERDDFDRDMKEELDQVRVPPTDYKLRRATELVLDKAWDIGFATSKWPEGITSVVMTAEKDDNGNTLVKATATHSSGNTLTRTRHL